MSNGPSLNVSDVYAGRLVMAFALTAPSGDAVKAARELLGITRRDARRLVAEIRRLEGL